MALIELNNVQSAWLAGIIDGEGCIETSYYPNIRVTNTCRELLEKIKEITKVGNVYERAKGSRSVLVSYEYVVSAHDEVRQILNCVLPYLIVKKGKALHAVQIITLRDWKGRHGDYCENLRKDAVDTYLKTELTVPRIAEKLKVSPSTIMNWIRQFPKEYRIARRKKLVTLAWEQRRGANGSS